MSGRNDFGFGYHLHMHPSPPSLGAWPVGSWRYAILKEVRRITMHIRSDCALGSGAIKFLYLLASEQRGKWKQSSRVNPAKGLLFFVGLILCLSSSGLPYSILILVPRRFSSLSLLLAMSLRPNLSTRQALILTVLATAITTTSLILTFQSLRREHRTDRLKRSVGADTEEWEESRVSEGVGVTPEEIAERHAGGFKQPAGGRRVRDWGKGEYDEGLIREQVGWLSALWKIPETS